jgi:hypothetical protein
MRRLVAFTHRKDAWRASGYARVHHRSSIRRAMLATDPRRRCSTRSTERHYPEFVVAREAAGRQLPKYVQEEFEAYLKCGRLEHGYMVTD